MFVQVLGNWNHTIEVFSQGALVDVLVDESLLLLGSAVAHQGHQVPVVHSGEDVHFVEELYRPLLGCLVQDLHCNLGSIWQLAVVDLTEASFSNDLLIMIGCSIDLRK